MDGGQPGGAPGEGRDRTESLTFAHGCLWSVGLGVLLWLLAGAAVVCAVAGCWE
jgi:hypothetical protein